ncbi:cerebellar degeneration-related protein 2 isoform X2 [Hypomesus transpacificus]|uniref:cerebellar degeneration-related protein 2 isoform X2 n=1 Tax=Hypomesus transpacificus TaxID=137520 RepID=UPI001F085A68|nr:cerebellar degeneration-related protein 2 isoform X2 [Hypomesus transpacificus]
MLTDMIGEEEFEVREEEPWYDRQDLEHDLHLAAELGKVLLDRNHELEQGLKQLYSTNQEQVQEIEYLAKQVDLLRQVNDQHAKVYEQLDLASRDLDQGNTRLVQDNRLAHQKIHSLTETNEGLQSHLEELQVQVEELRTAQADHSKRELAEHRRSLGAQSVSCLELYDLQHDRFLAYKSLRVAHPWTLQYSISDSEEEQESFQRSVQALQAQLCAERGQREMAEQETELMTRENGALEQRLALLEGYRSRQRELEEEVEELRLLWRADYTTSAKRPDQLLLPDTIYFPSEEKPVLGQGKVEGKEDKDWAAGEQELGRRTLQRCSSESVLKGTNAVEIQRGHERMCIRRAEVVKQRGISLLNEVDAQNSALQVKYEELLQRCQQGADGLSHKAVQTPSSPQVGLRPQQRLSSSAALMSELPAVLEDGHPLHQPEYKALFQEIFSRIHKTKEDLSENKRSCPDH